MENKPEKSRAPRIIFQTLLILTGLFLMADTMYVRTLSNYNLGVIMPFIIGAPLFILGVFYGPVTRFMRSHIIGKIIKWGMVAAYAGFFTLFTATTIIAVVAGSTQPDDNADVLVVLGAGIRGEHVSVTLYNRLNKAVEYLERNPSTAVIVSGGQGEGEAIPEALAVKRFLMNSGIDESRIITEDQSRSTLENFMFSKPIIESRFGEDAKVVFVTTAFHVYRAGKVAESAGLKAQGLGTPSAWYIALNDYMRECAAITHYLLAGRLGD